MPLLVRRLRNYLTVVKMSDKVSGLLDKQLTFDSFGLDDRILKALSRQQLEHPTLIQSSAIPLALQGKDILARARYEYLAL